MIQFELSQRAHRHIDIAPLVDVVFLLLLFFMLAYQAVQDPSILVNLPQSTTADQNPTEMLTLVVDDQERIYLQEQVVALKDLPSMMRSLLHQGVEPEVKIMADKKVGVGLLVKLMDASRTAGVQQIHVMTSKSR